MTLTISPSKLRGTITPPPSKSQAHRGLMAAYLGSGTSKISNLAQSQDIIATTRCMEALCKSDEIMPLLDCGESGSTIRFLVPVALALKGGARFTGHGRLLERPMTPYNEAFASQGIDMEFNDENGQKILRVSGQLKAGTYHFAGNVSSQFITGMLYALPLIDGTSEIVVTSPLESKGYVDMTLEVLKKFGIQVENHNYQRFIVPGGQTFSDVNMTVESDYSQAAFFAVAQAIGNDITMTGLNPNSVQGDMAILDYVNQSKLSGEISFDVSQCPDIVPILAVLCCMRTGETSHIINAARLRIKESDRLDTTMSELCKLGANITQTEDSLTIKGITSFSGGEVDAHNDHRIAMMLAIASTCATGEVVLHGSECVAKSYPNFWEDFASLGGVYR